MPYTREQDRAYKRTKRAEKPGHEAALQRAQYERNKEKINERQRAAYAAKTERDRLDRRLRTIYGISADDFDKMLADQDGVCAFCKGGPARKTKRLFVDHCHETGRVRGLLCLSCNQALGRLGDNVESIERVLVYLKR